MVRKVTCDECGKRFDPATSDSDLFGRPICQECLDSMSGDDEEDDE